MDNFFNDIKGIEIVEHKQAPKGHDDLDMQLMALGGILLAATAILSLIVIFFSLPVPEWVCVLSLMIGLSVCVGALISYPIVDPEQYILRITDDVSANALLQIQTDWDLKRGDEPDVWIATPKKT